MPITYYLYLSREDKPKPLELTPPLELLVDPEHGLGPEHIAKQLFYRLFESKELKHIPHYELRVHDIQWNSPDSQPIPDDFKKKIAREFLMKIRPDRSLKEATPS